MIGMQATGDVLLRIFVGEDDRRHGVPLYRHLVEAALRRGMAGATVLPGPFGFGPTGHARSELNVDAPAHAPMVVEIVDTDRKIHEFLAAVDAAIETGLVTMEPVQARFYGRSDRRATGATGSAVDDA
jgi:hypothetical protein